MKNAAPRPGHETSSLLEIDAKRPAFYRHGAGTHGFQSAQHEALSPQRLVGEADDQVVPLGDRRGSADVPGHRDFIAMRVERAGSGKGSPGGASDPGVAMLDH